MTFLSKIFGKKKADKNSSEKGSQPSQVDPANDPNMIKVYDGYGREMYITKQQWRDNVFLDNLEKNRDDPDQLYAMIVGALQDGFAADIISYAEHLWRIDTIPSRGATILGIVYMENNRLDDAEHILNGFLSKHAEDGVVLTNLAKVYSRRGDDAKAESTLWHALEVDPNQDNGLGWYIAIHHERGGEASALEAYRRVATLSGSWRAQLWLARDALQRKDLVAAKDLYKEALLRFGNHIPPDLLMQMSGDLGNNGYLDEVVNLVEPLFNPAFHGLQVGNNLIKANLELGKTTEARCILDQLYAQKHSDWQETLRYWDTELAKTSIKQQPVTSSDKTSITLMLVEGPLWSRDGSPFAKLLPHKADGSKRIAVFGSTALLADAPKKPLIQLSDSPGRISRAIPLILSERIHLTTDATGIALIPWAQGQGFALFGSQYDDQHLCDFAGKDDKAPDFIVGLTLDATHTQWRILFRLIRRTDAICLAEEQFEATSDNLESAVENISEKIERLLIKHAGISITPTPKWYQVPNGQDLSEYLLRLEQQLAVTCMHLDFLEGGALSGEREILDGILQFCVSQPTNRIVRILFAQTLRQMQKVRPKILSEYREKINLLQHDYPLTGEIGELIEYTITQTFKDEK